LKIQKEYLGSDTPT